MTSTTTSSRKMEEDLANVEFETSEDVEVKVFMSKDSRYWYCTVPHVKG